MDRKKSDIDILHEEIIKSKIKPKHIKRLTADDIEQRDYFAFLDGIPEPEYSVGVFWKNRIDDEY